MKTNEKNKLSSIDLFDFSTSYNSELTELVMEIKKYPLFQDIINSKTFNRLKYIAFLGAIDYLYKNKKRHTRYEHTLSVASLALKYAKLKSLKEEDRKYLLSFLKNESDSIPLRVENIIEALRENRKTKVLPKRNYKFIDVLNEEE